MENVYPKMLILFLSRTGLEHRPYEFIFRIVRPLLKIELVVIMANALIKREFSFSCDFMLALSWWLLNALAKWSNISIQHRVEWASNIVLDEEGGQTADQTLFVTQNGGWNWRWNCLIFFQHFVPPTPSPPDPEHFVWRTMFNCLATLTRCWIHQNVD